MKLSDFKDDAALDLVAELIEPISEIAQDEELTAYIKGGKKAKAVSFAIKNHKKEVVEIMAAMNGEEVDNFHFNAIALPKMVMDFLNDETLQELFPSAERTKGARSSGSASENTGESAI